jgi:flagellar assembly factor FliW
VTAHRIVSSPWIGDVAWDPQCELLFPNGLPGFEDERRMIPVEIPAQRPLVYLQSLEQPGICFVCLPVLVIDPAFLLRLSEDEQSALLLARDSRPVIGADVLCLGLLVPSGDSVEVNLNAPIVINLHNARGVQCVAPDSRSCFRLDENGHWGKPC